MNARFQPAPHDPAFDDLLSRPGLRLRIGDHVLDVGALRLVTRPDHPRLTSKAVAVLIELARHAGDTVTRERLLDRVWAGRIVTPDVLTQAVGELRRAFADDDRLSRYVETIPKVGYRLLAAVAVLAADDAGVIAAAQEAANAETQAAHDANGAGARDGAALPSRQRLLPGVAGAAAVVLLGLAWWTLQSRPADVGVASPWRVADLRAITSDPGPESRPRISPDGTRVAYVKIGPGSEYDRIHVRAIQPSAVSHLAPVADAAEELPVWSPDGSQIAFERLGWETCEMFVASSAGGALREVGACGDRRTNIFDWTPDGRSLITAEPRQTTGAGAAGDLALEKLDVASGKKAWIGYDHGSNDQDLEARYSPDGKWIAFRRGIAPYSNLCVMSANGGAVRQLTHVSARIRGYTWTRDSSALVFSSNLRGPFELFVIGLRDGDLRPLGVRPAEYPSGAHADDTVVYEIPRSTYQLAEVAVGGDGTPAPLAASTGSDDFPALSPDGSRVVFVSDRSGSQQLWLYDNESRTASLMTNFNDAVVLDPAWSADGRKLVATVRRENGSRLVEIDVASRRQRTIGDAREHVLSGGYGAEPDSYLMLIGASSPDDRLVYLRSYGMADESSTTLAAGVAHAELDRAGHRVYYTKTAQRGLFRRELPGNGPEEFVTPLVTSTHLDGWRVVDGRIWYVTTFQFNPTPIREFDPANGNDREIGAFKVALNDLNFSVDAARKRIVMVPIATEDTDVGAFRLVAPARAADAGAPESASP